MKNLSADRIDYVFMMTSGSGGSSSSSSAITLLLVFRFPRRLECVVVCCAIEYAFRNVCCDCGSKKGKPVSGKRIART